MQVRIRPLTAEDFPAVSRIYQQGIEGGQATFETIAPTWEIWNASHIQDCRMVLESAGEVLGWAALTPHSSRCVFGGVAEVSIYLDHAAQGKGYGEALLHKQVQDAENAGFWTLHSWIMQENTGSIRLHEKCGFRMVGYREKIGRDRFGEWRNVVVMERRSTDARYL